MRDVERAESLLTEGVTCALVCGEKTVTCTDSGILPLIELIDSGESFSGWSAADRIVGRAAAMLYAYMGISDLYAEVVSASAVEELSRHRIALTYSTLTPEIINRRGDGQCPMEQAVRDTDTPIDALAAVRRKLEEMSLSRGH